MDNVETLNAFKAQLSQFEKFQSFVDKARNYSNRFNPAVVDKVIADNTAKMIEVADAISPMVATLGNAIRVLETERADIASGVESAKFAIQELELRLAIGEMNQGDFDGQSADHKSAVQSADSRTAAIDTELGALRDVLSKWSDMKPELTEESSASEDAFGAVDADAGVHATTVHNVSDDVSVVFDSAPAVEPAPAPAPVEAPSAPPVEAKPIEAVAAPEPTAIPMPEPTPAPAAEPIVAAAPEPMPMPEPAHTPVMEVAEPEAPADSGIRFNTGELEAMGEPLGAQADQGRPEPDVAVAARSGDRAAVLVLQEGTSEEHVYPFPGEVMSLGRGRDNTVQVKNDSKVSRYHCKLFVRGDGFFIEDNKSANGTLVNGELITERRLFGGEEIIVGETFFRFRVGA